MTDREGTPRSAARNDQPVVKKVKEYDLLFPISTPPAVERQQVEKTPSLPFHVTPPSDSAASICRPIGGDHKSGGGGWTTKWTSPRYPNQGGSGRFHSDSFGYNPSFRPPPYSPSIHPPYQHPIAYQAPWQYQYAWSSPSGAAGVSVHTPPGAYHHPSSGCWPWSQSRHASIATNNEALHSSEDFNSEKRKCTDLVNTPNTATWKKRKWCKGADVWSRLSGRGQDDEKENEDPATIGATKCGIHDDIAKMDGANGEDNEEAAADDKHTTHGTKQKVWYKAVPGGDAMHYRTKEAAEDAMKHVVEGGSFLRAQGTKMPSKGRVGKQWYFCCKESSCPLLVRIKEVQHVVTWDGASQCVVWYIVEHSTSEKNGQMRDKHNHALPQQYDTSRSSVKARAGSTPV
jgi:hypothetical protein